LIKDWFLRRELQLGLFWKSSKNQKPKLLERRELDMKTNGKSLDRRTFLKVSGGLAAASVLGFPNILRGKEPTAVKIGGVWPITGVMASGGNACKTGAQIAIEEINQAGGIKSLDGAKLELLIGDAQSKPDVGMAEEERLIQRGVDVTMGCWDSGTTFAVTQVAAKYGMPHLVDMAVSPEITERGFTNIFKLAGTPESSAQACVRDLKKLMEVTGVKPKTGVILAVNTLFGQNEAKFFHKHLPKIIDIMDNIRYPAGTNDLTAELTKIKAMKPDMFFPCNYLPDGILMTRQMKTLNFDCIAVWGMYSPAHCVPEFMENLGKLAEYSWNTIESADYKLKRYWDVSTKYKKIMRHNLPMDAAFSYTMVYVLADALERAKSTKRDKLLEALRKTYFKDHIMAGGPVLFDKTGQCMNDYNVAQQILKGEFQNIYPEKYQTMKPVFPIPKWSERAL
jgi:branched-chain amino acid transport system substrate-binding protein